MRKNKNTFLHTPVLLQEVINFLSVNKYKLYLDGTFGDGGHSTAILEQNENCKVLAIDRDPDVLQRGMMLAKRFKKRFKLVIGKISNIEEIIKKEKYHKVDGVVLDLGVSTRQLKDTKRGFSFKSNGPLDMRMEKKGQTAEQVLNNFKEEELSNIIFKFGEEKQSRKIAKAINEYKKRKRIKTTIELAEIINSVKFSKNKKINPSTKTFQAIRIYINNEIEELKKGLYAVKKVLRKGGRLAVISFHSLEDREVKNFIYKNSGKIYNNSRYLPEIEIEKKLTPSFKILTKKVVKPNYSEIKKNFYSRSAKLRVVERL